MNKPLEQFNEEANEYDNIQIKLSKMNEVELESEYAQKLIDRAAEIRNGWRE